jgi:hypothetical protein
MVITHKHHPLRALKPPAGLLWRKHASIIKLAFDSTKPMDAFVEQSKALFEILGKGGCILVDDYAQRFALATVGIACVQRCSVDYHALDVKAQQFVWIRF